MTKTENIFTMLRLIADFPGKLGPEELAKTLDVSERAVFQYVATAVRAGIMVCYKDKGYAIEDEYWLNFLTHYRRGTHQVRRRLVKLLITAVKFTVEEDLRKQGEEFLALLGVKK